MTSDVADATQLDGQATQAEPVTESSDLEEARALLGEETQDEPEQEPDALETEAEEEEEDAELTAVIEARSQRAAEEAAERVRSEERQRAEEERGREERVSAFQGIQRSFETRAPRIRAHLDAVAQGEAELNIDGILNEFNQHHAQAASVIAAQFWDVAETEAKDGLSEEGQKAIADARRTAKDFPSFQKAIREAQRKEATANLHPQSRLDEERALGSLAFKRRLEKLLKDDPTGDSVLSLLKGRTQPSRSRGGAAAASAPKSMTKEWAETAPIEELIRVRQQAG